MSEEDNELEKLKAKRLAEMQKNLSSKQEQKKDKSTPREIVISKLPISKRNPNRCGKTCRINIY